MCLKQLPWPCCTDAAKAACCIPHADTMSRCIKAVSWLYYIACCLGRKREMHCWVVVTLADTPATSSPAWYVSTLYTVMYCSTLALELICSAWNH